MEPQPTPKKKLLDQVRDALRLKQYSHRTEQAYVGWITRYVLFHDKRHPSDMVLRAGLNGGEEPKWMVLAGAHRLALAINQFGRRYPNPYQAIRPLTR